jgi:hypothetical protein
MCFLMWATYGAKNNYHLCMMFTFKPIQNKMGANIVTLPIFSRALRIYQNTHVRYLSSGYILSDFVFITSATDDIYIIY